jgi:hypothetical protein
LLGTPLKYATGGHIILPAANLNICDHRLS